MHSLNVTTACGGLESSAQVYVGLASAVIIITLCAEIGVGTISKGLAKKGEVSDDTREQDSAIPARDKI